MRDIFSERDDWKKPVAISAGLHGLLAAFVVLAGYVSGARAQTGGVGDAPPGESVQASLVNSIPLPHPQVTTENILANESKGQAQSVPEQPVQEQPDAIPIPEKPPKHRIDRNPVTPTHERPQPTPVPQDNRVPFGQGGPITGSFTNFTAANAKGGVGIQGGGTDSRFNYYLAIISTKISQNWYQSEIAPNVGPHRVWVTFDIFRDGSHTDPHLEQSSGIPSLDTSTLRAIQRIDTFGPLPVGYSGSKFPVEFWFDYQK